MLRAPHGFARALRSGVRAHASASPSRCGPRSERQPYAAPSSDPTTRYRRVRIVRPTTPLRCRVGYFARSLNGQPRCPSCPNSRERHVNSVKQPRRTTVLVMAAFQGEPAISRVLTYRFTRERSLVRESRIDRSRLASLPAGWVPDRLKRDRGWKVPSEHLHVGRHKGADDDEQDLQAGCEREHRLRTDERER